MLSNGKRRPDRHHLILGNAFEPDCPICREHPPLDEDILFEGPGILVVRSEPFEPKEGCTCPLCAEFRFDPEEN